MLKYQDIIKKMTLEQKLQLVADYSALGGVVFEEEGGFKCLKETSFATVNSEKIVGGGYPTFGSMANSWNEELIGRVADELVVSAKEDGATLINLPRANVKVSPHSAGMSEDPVLCSKLASEIIGSGTRAGIVTCVSDPLLTEEDAAYSDIKMNERAVYEHFYRPFDACLKSSVGAIKTANIKIKEPYQTANEQILAKVCAKKRVIYTNVTPDKNMEYTGKDRKYCKNGSVIALKDATERYKKLREYFELGEISLGDVDRACDSGSALSPEMLDSAVDRLLDFAEYCQKETKKANGPAIDKRTALKAIEESIVLLKNKNKTLPIKKRVKTALVGRLAEYPYSDKVFSLKTFFQRLKKKHKIRYAGYVQGYEGEKDRNEGLIREASLLASKADTVIVAIGHDKEGGEKARRNRNSKLPANQMALLETLYKSGKKIVAIVYGDGLLDMQFEKFCSAILLAPVGGERSAQALFNIIYGKVSPSGKLANTLYEETDAYFEELRNYKNAGRNKVGTFYGYRHYDTGRLKVKYPFGYGLSYTQFAYSNLKIKKGKVSVTVKNVGKKAGSEIVQLYVGKRDSSILRPRKELKDFVKVYLKRRKKKTITFDLTKIDVRVYDDINKQMVIEGGNYELYVASAVNAVKLKGKFKVHGITLPKDKHKPTDYFQSLTNIHSDEYHLEVPMKMPKESQEKRRKFMTGLSIFVLCLDFVYFYLAGIGFMPKGWLAYLIVGGVTVLPIVSAWGLWRRRNELISKFYEESKRMKQEIRDNLNINDLSDELPYEELFAEEFAKETITVAVEEDEVVDNTDLSDREFEFDENFPLSQVSSEFVNFVQSNGLTIDATTVRSLFASFASSRLIILSNEDRDMLNSFITILGKYFGSESVVESFSFVHLGSDDIVCRYDENEHASVTNIARSIMSDNDVDQSVRVMAFTDTKSEYIKSCFAPVLRYIDQPEREAIISVRTETIDERYKMPENVWFIVTLADGELVSDIPKFILDVSCVIDLSLRPAIEKKERVVPKFGMAKTEEVEEQTEEVVQETEQTDEEAQEQTEKQADENVDGEQTSAQVEETENEVQEEQTEQGEQTENSEQAEEQVEEPAEQGVEQEQVDGEEKAQEQVSEEQASEEQEQTEEEPEEKVEYKQLFFHQFVKLAERAERDVQMDEMLWKRVDKLEDYVATMGDYRIDNKLWHRLEKYVSVFLSTGGVAEEAVDNVVANHLIHGMVPSLVSGKDKAEDKFYHVVENIFGEGHAPRTVKAVKNSGHNI